MRRAAGFVLIVLATTVSFAPSAASDAPPRILIYGPTLWTGGENEQTIMESLGYSVTVVDETTWSQLATADFASYDVLVFGDPQCGIDPSILNTAVANEATWVPAVTGSMVVIGTDPVEHEGIGQFRKLMSDGISFAAHGNGTGLYAALSCYYFKAPVDTTVDLLAGFGHFGVQGQYTPPFDGCPTQVSITDRGRRHPALRGITPNGLENGTCTIHEAFDSFPQNFGALAEDADFHIPYIVATKPRG
jgi:hypothetical protein